MIQRIQSLYLLIIVILSTFTLFSPFATFLNNADTQQFIVNYKGVFLVEATGLVFKQNVWALTSLAAIIPILSMLTIFLFKNRMLQIRLTIFNTVLMAGYYALLAIYLWQAIEVYHADLWFLKIVTAFPFVNIILSILVIRAIGKDEALIKSLNRIR